MPAIFRRFGFTLLYPETWAVDIDPEYDSALFTSPGGAMLTISKLAEGLDPLDEVQGAIDILRREYDIVEREETSKQLAGVSLDGSILRFFYLDLVVAAQVLAFHHAGIDYVIQIQAEDREHDELQPVFDAILTSLCQGLLESDA